MERAENIGGEGKDLRYNTLETNQEALDTINIVQDQGDHYTIKTDYCDLCLQKINIPEKLRELDFNRFVVIKHENQRHIISRNNAITDYAGFAVNMKPVISHPATKNEFEKIHETKIESSNVLGGGCLAWDANTQILHIRSKSGCFGPFDKNTVLYIIQKELPGIKISFEKHPNCE